MAQFDQSLVFEVTLIGPILALSPFLKRSITSEISHCFGILHVLIMLLNISVKEDCSEPLQHFRISLLTPSGFDILLTFSCLKALCVSSLKIIRLSYISSSSTCTFTLLLWLSLLSYSFLLCEVRLHNYL